MNFPNPKNAWEFWYMSMDRWGWPVIVLVLSLAVTMMLASNPDWSEVRASSGIAAATFGAINILKRMGWTIEIRPPSKGKK